jgi:hypothetical protein
VTFPALRTVSYIPFADSTVDSLGNTVLGYGTPVDIAAMAWAPHGTETWPGTTTLVETADIDLYLPKGTAVGLKDRFIVSGAQYEVIGVHDWTDGLIALPSGLVVALREVSG